MSTSKRIWPGGSLPLSPSFLSFLAYGVLLFVLLGLPLLLGGVEIQEGWVALQDIVAPETVKIVDALATEKRRGKVLDNLPPVYRVDEEVVQETQRELEQFFSTFEEIRTHTLPSLPETVESLSRKWNVTKRTVLWLLEAPDEVYRQVRSFIHDLFATRFFSRPLRREDLSQVLLDVNTSLEESGLSEGAVWVLSLLVTRFLRPNAVVDELQTQKIRTQILQSLEPVRRVVRRGEILVQKGDIVTREQMQALEALGLVGRGKRWSLALVLCILLGGVLLLEYLYLQRFAPRFLRDKLSPLVRLFAVGGVIALNIFTLRISPFFFVIGALPLVLSVLFGREVALGESLLLFPLLLWIWRTGVPGGVLLYLHLIFPLFLFGRRMQRKDFVRMGGILSLSGASLGILFSLYEGLSLPSALGIILYGAAGGITSSVVALGNVSLFESIFHLTTDFRLMELLNPTHPLLKRLMMEAPGTYSHSLVVANLAEVAAEEIGGDVLLARVGAYYHDVGKLKRPYCFIENQVHEERNIHDRLSPYLSALVITSHVRDGVEIAQSFHLPKEVQSIIRSHHGRSIIRYFYEKARLLEGESVERDAFRYPGPLPQTPEEAIVFLADSVEAAVRSMKDPTPRRVEMTVRSIIRMYLEDGQLDESSLTLCDLNRIASRFVVFLSGMVHARVPYPSLEKEGVHEKG